MHIANLSAGRFRGWLRTTVADSLLAGVSQGTISGWRFVAAGMIGTDLREVDIEVELTAREEHTPGTNVVASELRRSGMAVTADTHGTLALNGEPMIILSIAPDGAGLLVHARRRIGSLLVVDVHLRWYPEMPGVARGTATITASNASVPDLECQLDRDLVLTFGSAIIWPLGRAPGAIAAQGTHFGDGQARIVPLTVIWLQHLTGPYDLTSAFALAAGAIAIRGLDRLYPEGNPRIAAGFDGATWQAENYGEALRRIHTWDVGTLGINKRSADTGAQEDQLVHGEALAHPMASVHNTLAAYKWANRPCHHRDWRGDVVKASDHPSCMLWDGRPHFAAPDRLGKPAPLPEGTTAGWSGPDEEHWLVGRLFEAARLTGDPALQLELEHQAQLYLGAQTLPFGEQANWFTSGPGASRAVGWKALLVHRLWHSLKDRALAEQVRERWTRALETILLPRFEMVDIWDVRVDDARLGPGAWWMPWQQAVGAYGVYLASQLVVDPTLRQRGVNMAQLAAQAVLRDAFVRASDGTWLTKPQRPVLGGSPADASFNHFGMPLALATILSDSPRHDAAREAWNYILSTATTQDKLRWMVPLPGE